MLLHILPLKQDLGGIRDKGQSVECEVGLGGVFAVAAGPAGTGGFCCLFLAFTLRSSRSSKGTDSPHRPSGAGRACSEQGSWDLFAAPPGSHLRCSVMGKDFYLIKFIVSVKNRKCSIGVWKPVIHATFYPHLRV